MTKFAVAAPLAAIFVIAMSAEPAQADTQETCNVTGVSISGQYSGVPYDVLIISCSDGNAFWSYIGTAGTGCYSDSDAVRSWEAIALSARVTGTQLTIFWNQKSCPGNSTAKIMDFVTM